MSRTLALGAVALASIASTAAAGSPIGFYAYQVYVPNYAQIRPTTPVCAPHYDRNSYTARPYCPDYGEARQFFITGQVIPAGFGMPVGYAQLNSALRTEYRLDPERDYVFAAGYLYETDHGTKAIKRVIPVDFAR